MSSIRIASMNCQGLEDLNKRRDVFNYLKQKPYSICCLQDTHFTAKEENIIRSMWGFETYISPGTSDSSGVAILFNNNFEFEIISETKDKHGNYIALNVQIEQNLNLYLINIYGPNRDSPEFYQNIKQLIQENKHDFTMITGDFNLVQDPLIDYYNNYKQNKPCK